MSTSHQQELLDKIRKAGSVGIPVDWLDARDLAPLVRTGDAYIVFARVYAEDPRPLDAA